MNNGAAPRNRLDRQSKSKRCPRRSASFTCVVNMTSARGSSLLCALAAASERPHVLVDVSDCTFIDSTVIAVLFAAHRQQVMRNQRPELILTNGADTVERILTLTRVDLIVTVHETRGAALAGLQVEISRDEPAGS